MGSSNQDRKSSPTLDAIIGFVYRKDYAKNRCGRYGKTVIEGLKELGFLKEINSPKGRYFFKTDKAKNFKAIDFAIEYLWAMHNTHNQMIKDSKKYILCFDSKIKNGQGLIEINEAIKNCYV